MGQCRQSLTESSFPSYNLTEWEECLIPLFNLTPKDYQLVSQLSGEAGRIDIDELRNGIRVRARSWVGVVRFENFELRIVPKLAGDNLKLIEMLTFASGLHALRRNLGQRLLSVREDDRLFDLLALILAEECERLLLGGVLYDFRELEETLSVLRGRLLIGPQIRKRFGRVDTLECRYDDHSMDIIENQILAAALTICGKRVMHPDVRRKVRRLGAIFSTICQPGELDLRNARNNMVYDRLNQHYENAHQLAWLILDCFGIDDLLAPGETQCFAFLLDMDRLFELFVLRFVEGVLRDPSFNVRYQHRDRSILWDATHHNPYAHIVPDLLIERSPQVLGRLVIDAKYKLYDEHKVTAADIYQSFLYAYAYNSPGATRPHALLIYPTQEKPKIRVDLQIRSSAQIVGAGIQVLGINIPQSLIEIKNGCVGETSTLLSDAIEQFLPVSA